MTQKPQNGSANAPSGQQSGPTVLVVEDEDSLRRVIRRLLQEEGYGVLEAPNGASALQILEEVTEHQVGLVLTDLRMPIMDGRQLAAALARLRPSLPIIIMSGYTAQLMDMRLVSPQLAFLAKPVRDDDLLAMVRGQLERFRVAPLGRTPFQGGPPGAAGGKVAGREPGHPV